jgi:hypothetical protein
MNRGFRFVVAQNTVRPHIIAHTIMPLAWGDTMVYVAAYSSAAFSSILAGTLDSPGLLPAGFAGGRANRDVMSLMVSDREGHALFADHGVHRWSARHALTRACH